MASSAKEKDVPLRPLHHLQRNNNNNNNNGQSSRPASPAVTPSDFPSPRPAHNAFNRESGSAPATPMSSTFQLPQHSFYANQAAGSSALSVASDASKTSSSAAAYGDEFRYKTMITYLNNRVVASGWIPPPSARSSSSRDGFGVLYKKSRGIYVTSPEDISPPLLACVQRLNLVVAFTMRPQMLEGILASLSPNQTELKLMDGSQLQIAESLGCMVSSNTKKFQYAALVRQEGMLLVWHDDLQQIIPQASRLEEKLLSLVWGTGSLPFGLLGTNTNNNSRAPSVYSSTMSVFRGAGAGTSGEKSMVNLGATLANDSSEQLEKDESMDAPESLSRPVIRTSAVFVGMAMCLAIVLLFGTYISQLLIECVMDGTYTRLALIVCVPLLLCVSLFFFQVIFSNLFQIVGPIGGTQTNSRYYSCHKPSLRRAYMDGFTAPHITIQMPVYKEGMESVIVPTVRSLQAAISYYESHGGSASIFINDDGLRVISEDEAAKRVEFYHDNNIGWVARPKHGADGFLRKGKFKKASNMNFALNISQKVEKYLQDMVDARCQATGLDVIDEQEEEEMYQLCLARVLKENPLAQAAGNIRMGEFILIVDSDTRVPVDCLLYGAAEMFLSPEVAIVQHSTGVMQVSWDYFENGITFFTNMVYTAIRFSIGSGEVAPFVGHNAFLRWQAVQDVGVVEDGGYVAYWSESHVSEDFDIALRLQIKGSIVRVASYHGDGFQEGVSLTIYDEIARWQKYAYGVSEMIFHPLYRWPLKGPFTPLFYTFLGSNIMYSSKISIFAYICSYFALASALMLTLLNYFLVGWFADQLDHCYMSSWQVFVALIAVFNVMGHVALATFRYRSGDRSLLGSLLENFKWTPMFTIFFGGLSFHVSAALLAHLLHIDMQWGATSKEKENSNFFQEIPKILKTFKYMYLCLILLAGGMVYLARWAPRGWVITDFTAVVPLAVNMISHALTPLVLNPSLMVFNY
ncbi:glycosyl transferase family group 2-domain-containing protein [Diplogelasinospora grovesii]|uniref:Glycosyl transferase family group 2-domain-containing protein n=1 Tax=Diplogelasinospora grovesii TaxID=303347 RepID=A0AAN6NEA0_9PEZI|nr:glycosyl transferase family group 2-domain-containing protein [Diplogelasinospora grovesii]